MTDLTIRNDEQIVFMLRSLYESYGYKQYKMTKFEEYELYVKNKDFLISENVITFNDTNGRLMALKPDVTLSIIKNKTDSKTLNKVYYNENVYRVSKGTDSFKEIMQAGLECIGDVDNYCLSEVLSLAGESLIKISDKCILSVSDLDIVSDLLQKENATADAGAQILDLIGKKNIHELVKLCKENEISDETVNALVEIVSAHGKPEAVFLKLHKLLPENEKVEKFETIINSLDERIKDIIEIDFSTVGDSKYYNGIAFKGFIYGVSGSVLSGGQYDKLMKRMKRKDKAIGFAIYLDMLERLNETRAEFDVDVVLLYDSNSDIKLLNSEISKLTAEEKKVTALKEIPNDIRYRTLMKFDGKEAKIYEANA